MWAKGPDLQLGNEKQAHFIGTTIYFESFKNCNQGILAPYSGECADIKGQHAMGSTSTRTPLHNQLVFVPCQISGICFLADAAPVSVTPVSFQSAAVQSALTLQTAKVTSIPTFGSNSLHWT